MKFSVDRLVTYLQTKGPVVFLESQSKDHPAGNVSYIAALPEVILKAEGNQLTVEKEAESRIFEASPWDALSAFRKEYDGWMFGYLGYDLKNALEDLQSQNPDLTGAPDMFFMIPGLLLQIDHRLDEMNTIKGKLPAAAGVKTAHKKPFAIDALKPSVRKEEYITHIKEGQRRIREGDFYEINLSHPLQGTCSGNSYELYKKMRAVGPVPFGAYLAIDDWSVCCMSPERFLKKEGNRVCSQPVKGTMQRGATVSEDKVLKEKLEASLKDKAENLMIVDLVRNDLSRIAVKNSVKVSRLFDIQTFGTVHQMVSTIEAETQIADPVEIIKACYPMGSMTGAPKISVMKAIDELENYHRGIYSGAIGYVTPEGDFDFNVVIRTAIIKDNSLVYSVGGAITGDSDPAAEWEETMVKARAIMRAIVD